MKKRGMNVLRVLVSAGALAFLFWKIGLGETLAVLGQADLCYLLAAFLLFVISLVIRTCRWFVLLRGLALGIPFGRLVHLYFVGAFFNAFLPTGFGGDVVRALELSGDTNTSAAVGTVLLDRMSGLLVLFAMGLIALPFTFTRLEPWLAGLLVGIAGGGLLAGALVLEGRFLRRVTGRLPSVLSLRGKGFLAQVYAAVTGCGRRAVLEALGVSLVFNVVNVLINWLCGLAVGIPQGPGFYFIVTPLISVTLLVPVSISGLGVRDWVAVALFGSVGVDANTAAAMSLSIYLVSAAAGLVGGMLYGIEGLRGLREREPV